VLCERSSFVFLVVTDGIPVGLLLGFEDDRRTGPGGIFEALGLPNGSIPFLQLPERSGIQGPYRAGLDTIGKLPLLEAVQARPRKCV
jgi:hypothetical protein